MGHTIRSSCVDATRLTFDGENVQSPCNIVCPGPSSPNDDVMEGVLGFYDM